MSSFGGDQLRSDRARLLVTVSAPARLSRCAASAEGFLDLTGRSSTHAAAELGGNNFNDLPGFCTANGSTQGQTLILTVVFIPRTLECASRKGFG